MMLEPQHPLVLHVRVVSGTGGGPDKTILNSPRFLRTLGYRSTCVYLRDPADRGFDVLVRRAVERHAPLVAVDDFGIRDWRIISRLRSVLDADPPIIWHGHDYKSNLLGLILKRWFPQMRLVTTVHGWVQKTRKTPLYYFIDRQCLPRYEAVICVSRDLQDRCRKLGVEEKKLRLIDNAIALDDYAVEQTQAEAKRQFGVPDPQRLVVAVGRLSYEKGFDLLIQAVAELVRGGHDIGLLIAGDGGEREVLAQRSDDAGVSDRVRLLGFVDDPRLVYRAADVYVLSSRREGLPNVVLEAMAMGIPVVATKIAGMPDLIEDRVNGVLVSPDSHVALSSAINELLTDAGLARKIGDAGRKTVEDRFSFQRRMEKVVQVYQSIGVEAIGNDSRLT